MSQNGLYVLKNLSDTKFSVKVYVKEWIFFQFLKWLEWICVHVTAFMNFLSVAQIQSNKLIHLIWTRCPEDVERRFINVINNDNFDRFYRGYKTRQLDFYLPLHLCGNNQLLCGVEKGRRDSPITSKHISGHINGLIFLTIETGDDNEDGNLSPYWCSPRDYNSFGALFHNLYITDSRQFG